jgi:hypothetical protein
MSRGENGVGEDSLCLVHVSNVKDPCILPQDHPDQIEDNALILNKRVNYV